MPPPVRRAWRGRLLASALAGSLLANVVMLMAVHSRWWSAAGADSSPTRPERDTDASSGKPNQTAITAVDPQAWQKLAGEGPERLAERLRARGFPPDAIRTIVAAQVRERFADRYRALAGQAAAAPYWRGSAFSFSGDPKIERARRALDREVTEAVNQVLGPGVEELTESERRSLRRRYGDLSAEKAAEVERIAVDYEDLMLEVRSRSRGMLLPEDAQQLAYLEAEKRADLARLLTPEELEGSDLRSSRTADRLRSELAGFEPTEDEFRALFRLRHASDNAFESPDGTVLPDDRARRAEAEKRLAAQIADVLGPERYAEYQRKTDPGWLSTNRFVQRMGLPVTATDQLVSVQREVTERMAVIRSDPGLSPQQRQAHLAALAQEANTRLAPIVGEDGIDAYRRNTGYWLQALQTAAARPPTR